MTGVQTCALPIYRTAQVVITTNASQKRFALHRGHCAAEKVFIVRNGPDLQRIKDVAAEPALKGGRRYLLAYVGSMESQYGVEYALYALQDLVYQRGRQDIGLVLMGDGGQAAALRRLAHDLQLDAYVHFTGWVLAQDVVRYLRVADVGLTTCPKNAHNEYATSIKTMEYMAMGKPGVAFDLAETRFSAQEAALYAIPNRAGDFANNIETLLDNEELRESMGALGRKQIGRAHV